MTTHPTVRVPRFAAWIAAACALILLALVQSASAAPGVQTWTGQASGSTPDLELANLVVYAENGDELTNTAGTINFTVNGSAVIGYCVDTARAFSTGTEDVVLSDVTAPTQQERATGWILTTKTPTGAATPAKQFQGAVNQVAVWMLAGQVRTADPTDNAELNAAAAALRDQAMAVAASPASVQLSVGAPAAGAKQATVAIKGRAGAVVSLAVTSGAGTLSAPSVTLDANGNGSAVLNVAGPGTVGLSASTDGDAQLVRVDPQNETQSTMYAKPVTITAAASVTFTAAPTTTTPTTTTPTTTTPAPTPTVTAAQIAVAKLAIAKTGPARAAAGGTVTYRIVVRNTGKAPARNVVVADVTPSGLTLVTPPGRISGRTVSWKVGTLAPGASRTIVVRMRSARTISGTRTNVATATATGVAKVTARARTQFTKTRVAPAVRPAVTG